MYITCCYIIHIFSNFFHNLQFFIYIMDLHKYLSLQVMRCKMCAKEYCSKQNYDKHVKSCSSQVTYKCNDCQKMFKKINTLTEHRKNFHANVQVIITN